MRVVAVSDFHCGHYVGLTPPDWWYVQPQMGTRQKKIAQTQRELWGFWTKEIDRLKPIDRLIVVGDCVDGKGDRAGGTEQRAADRAEQADMATQVIAYTEVSKVLIVYGTPYHVGVEEDWEYEIVPRLKDKGVDVKISGQEWPIINGVQFDVKHFVSSSSIPHGQATPLFRDKLWNTIWHNERSLQPDSEIIIRAHVHYHVFGGGPGWLALTTPMMMGFGDKYGVRKMNRMAHIGFVVFDIDDEGNYSWRLVQATLPHMRDPGYVW